MNARTIADHPSARLPASQRTILRIHGASGTTDYTQADLTALARREAKAYGSHLVSWHLTTCDGGGKVWLTVVLQTCELGIAL